MHTKVYNEQTERKKRSDCLCYNLTLRLQRYREEFWASVQAETQTLPSICTTKLVKNNNFLFHEEVHVLEVNCWFTSSLFYFHDHIGTHYFLYISSCFAAWIVFFNLLSRFFSYTNMLSWAVGTTSIWTSTWIIDVVQNHCSSFGSLTIKYFKCAT